METFTLYFLGCTSPCKPLSLSTLLPKNWKVKVKSPVASTLCKPLDPSSSGSSVSGIGGKNTWELGCHCMFPESDLCKCLKPYYSHSQLLTQWSSTNVKSNNAPIKKFNRNILINHWLHVFSYHRLCGTPTSLQILGQVFIQQNYHRCGNQL